MRSEIAANLNVWEFVKIFGEICKTLGVRWSNRYGVTLSNLALTGWAHALFLLECSISIFFIGCKHYGKCSHWMFQVIPNINNRS